MSFLVAGRKEGIRGGLKCWKERFLLRMASKVSPVKSRDEGEKKKSGFNTPYLGGQRRRMGFPLNLCKT